MVRFQVSGDTLVLHVQGFDQLWSLKSELSIPLAHIADVEPAADEARKWYHGIRLPGTNLPGVITAGTFYDDTGRVFWDVHDPERAIALLLHDERYSRLIVEVENPTGAIAELRKAIADRGPTVG